MILINLSRKDFEYDVRSLVLAFYPEQEITFRMEPDADMEYFLKIDLLLEDYKIGVVIRYSQFENDAAEYHGEEEVQYTDRKVYKSVLKRLLYTIISKHSDICLPWGTLTGIRPTKLVTGCLERGFSKEQVIKHMNLEYFCSRDKADLSYEIARRELQILKDIDYEDGYSIYIGIPFCPTTCLYCSFPSFPVNQYKDIIDEYLDALEKEIFFVSECFRNKKLNTIYIGGGTPTALTADQLKRLLRTIENSFLMASLKEYTVEAGRPDSITKEKLRVLKEAHVSRISINPQTMIQNTLDIIGRNHTVEQIKESFYQAREQGHHNINMDLIIGLPGENADSVRHTLSEIGILKPDSLTVHTLALKRASNLNLNKDAYKELKASDVSEMQRETMLFANREGYSPYYLYRQKNIADKLENIGYAKHGMEGIYNILIMEERQNIIALGAGASSKFVFLNEGRIERVENVKNVKEYIRRVDEMIHRKRNFIEKNYFQRG